MPLHPTHVVAGWIVITMVVLSSCGGRTSPNTGPSDTSRVYATLLRDVVLAEGWSGPVSGREERAAVRQLVLRGETAPDAPAEIREYARDLLPMLSTTTIDDYESRYGPGVLHGILEDVGEYHWVSGDALAGLFEGGGWNEFYRDYPGSPGLVSFSRVGFGEGGDQALVYMRHGRGGHWGEGALYVLERNGGRWEIVGKASLWQS